MTFEVDIYETLIRDWGHEILENLLKDRTTGENIIWATNDYSHRGKGYSYYDVITSELICDDNGRVVQPRIAKSLEEQKKRINEKAEVYTPSWVCNAQNNLIDKAWFETEEDIFNREIIIDGVHSWEMTDSLPPYPSGKNWRTYISENRLEMACGEAPYLCSRYDATTGVFIPVKKRIGLLDRKLILVNANTPDITPEMDRKKRKNIHKIWRRAAYKALQSTYGFEWQGDNLLLARESLLITFIEFYQMKWQTDKLPDKECLKKVAEIISWNIWQMDGLKYGIPGYNPTEQLGGLPLFIHNREKFCRIKEWTGQEPLQGNEIIFVQMLNNKDKK
jgi:hypothetical protein